MESERTIAWEYKPSWRRHWLSVVAFVFSLLFMIAQIVIQFRYLPQLSVQYGDRIGFLIGWAVSDVINIISDFAWTPLTVDIDATFHRILLNTPLDDVQRDALRKNDNVDSVLRIFTTRFPATVASFVQVGQVRGTWFGLLTAAAFFFLNWISRKLIGQNKQIKEQWVAKVKRNNSFDSSDYREYGTAQTKLRGSSYATGFWEMVRGMIWTFVLLGGCYLVGAGLPMGVFGKIVKDANSLDSLMEKVCKNSIPAWILLKAAIKVRWRHWNLKAALEERWRHWNWRAAFAGDESRTCPQQPAHVYGTFEVK
ncbi:hypothetical protein BX600DRAFT_515359 [Xylariales sp. PMI_506]|nr:hypothetical protein BX600DRAFT_515359 [Xylariales sp. PMI_506]